MEPGTKLGPYEITEQLGAGGMGEVYLAQDTRLGRKVAIKVLPAEFASDPERLARFEQEARAAAALNHPHIAVVHDVGTEGDTHFMVQEYLEGDTLREPLGKGALPLKKALGLATEIAEALAAAHAAGIVHRDLKPENIFLTKEGHAKVLDFGLAKLTEVAVTGSPDGATQSPTMMGTVAGQMMGTAGYMAPEQVEGGEIDRRTDVFAFGCLLYELVSGTQPFSGESLHETLHRIGHAEPLALVELDSSLPAELQRIVGKCLAKAPTGRYQHADDLAVDLRSLALEVDKGTAVPLAVAVSGTGGLDPPVTATASRWPVAAIAALILVSASAGSISGWFLRQPGEAPAAHRARLSIDLPGPLDNSNVPQVPLAISPDGERMVFVIRRGVDTQLYSRELDAEGAVPIPGTEGGRTPFFSPDGSAIGYVSGNSIMRLSIDQSGFGVPVAVTATEGQTTGVSWGEDGMIYFTAISRLAPLRVPASGGTIEEITVADTYRAAGRYAAPQLLPGGEALLVTVRETEGTAVRSSVAVLSLASGRERILTPGTGALYLASGHLLWSVPEAPNASDAPLLAAPFDLQRLELTGAARPLPFRVGASPVDGRPHLAASSTGLVVYAPDFLVARESLVWVERDGTKSVVTAEPVQVWNPRLSPDGSRVAYSETNLTSIRILDLERMAISTLAIGGNINAFPMWMPDSDRLLVMASPDGPLDIISAAADSSGAWETVFHSDNTVVALSVGPDGTLLYYEVSTQGVRNIWALPPSGVPRPLVVTEASEQAPMMSPDGRYFAYVSDEEGSTEVYVRPYPDAGSRVRISTDGGTEPVWRRDGRELFYRSHDRMMSVSIQTEPSFRAGEPETLFEQPFQLDQWGNPNYDISLDGDRFLMVRTTPSTTIRLPVIVNWFDELKRLVPTDP